ncbi:MAG: phosphoribosylanthranilate isomerase [Desulfitobacteriaceae bacterium]
MTHIKICGIRSLEEALWAAEAGADALGFILVPSSKRYIETQLVREITAGLPPYIARIGVFANTPPAEVEEVAKLSGLTGIQLHGDEDPVEYRGISLPLIKALKVPVGEEQPSKKNKQFPDIQAWQGIVQGILVDSVYAGQFGGTGCQLPWDDELSQALFDSVKASKIPLILAGGLTLQNVCEGISKVQPYAIDVSSGVERNGKKDPALIKEIIQNVKLRT